MRTSILSVFVFAIALVSAAPHAGLSSGIQKTTSTLAPLSISACHSYHPRNSTHGYNETDGKQYNASKDRHDDHHKVFKRLPHYFNGTFNGTDHKHHNTSRSHHRPLSMITLTTPTSGVYAIGVGYKLKDVEHQSAGEGQPPANK